MNKFQNLSKMIGISENSWEIASNNKLVDLNVSHLDGPWMSYEGRNFINMCSCSYLGWDKHPKILDGAIEGIRKAKTLHLTTARCRISLNILDEYEHELSLNFGGTAVAYNSCAAASSAALPLLASGAFTDSIKPIMVFDKFAHFSMSHMKALCGDETEVQTIENNDMEQLEEYCKRHKKVAYVSDATYSIKGFANFPRLKELQEKYGLFIYLDDSHGLSITGENGKGVALTNFSPLNDKTIVVASLAKAFGAAGGVLLSGHKNVKNLLVRYGNAWSQYLNSASIGGGLASLKLHRGSELRLAQKQWETNLNLLDKQFTTINQGELSPVRVIPLPTPNKAIQMAKTLFENGFYTSAVFFPVVPKNTAGIRIMPRADIPSNVMMDFFSLFQSILSDEGFSRV